MRATEAAMSSGCITGWKGPSQSPAISKARSTPPTASEPSHGRRWPANPSIPAAQGHRRPVRSPTTVVIAAAAMPRRGTPGQK
jgi:hypothetical protein